MAVIRTFVQSSSVGRLHPTEVDAEWTIVETPTEVLLQITTFGSDNRVSGPKPSQTIQLRRGLALELGQLIATTYGEAERDHSVS